MKSELWGGSTQPPSAAQFSSAPPSAHLRSRDQLAHSPFSQLLVVQLASTLHGVPGPPAEQMPLVEPGPPTGRHTFEQQVGSAWGMRGLLALLQGKLLTKQQVQLFWFRAWALGAHRETHMPLHNSCPAGQPHAPFRQT